MQTKSGCVCKVYNFSETLHTGNYNGTNADQKDVSDAYYIIDVKN